MTASEFANLLPDIQEALSLLEKNPKRYQDTIVKDIVEDQLKMRRHEITKEKREKIEKGLRKYHDPIIEEIIEGFIEMYGYTTTERQFRQDLNKDQDRITAEKIEGLLTGLSEELYKLGIHIPTTRKKLIRSLKCIEFYAKRKDLQSAQQVQF